VTTETASADLCTLYYSPAAYWWRQNVAFT